MSNMVLQAGTLQSSSSPVLPFKRAARGLWEGFFLGAEGGGGGEEGEGEGEEEDMVGCGCAYVCMCVS